MKPGKYAANIKADRWTADQRTARAKWQRASGYRWKLNEALLMPAEEKSRAEMHKRLDYVLDLIDKHRTQARELFPDVDESFTIASMMVRL